jgi:hypothetical protein
MEKRGSRGRVRRVDDMTGFLKASQGNRGKVGSFVCLQLIAALSVRSAAID